MIRLGLRVSLRSGKESLIRLAVTAGAVGVGVALLLSVLAIYHGYQTTANRACWQCTGEQGPDSQGPPPGATSTPSTKPVANAELWNYSEDFYRGHLIEHLDVAALGPQAPIVPGLTRLPRAGEYFVSPALARLIASVPRDELGDRFSGAEAGLIGAKGLSGPDDLAIVIGHTPADLIRQPDISEVTAIQTTPHILGTSDIYKFGFGLGAIALLVPMLILIGNATRLAATRREERYAAMRLVGATTRQIGIVATVDAVIGALLGSALGIGIYALLHPLATRVTITGSRFFPGYITPTALGYVAVLVGVPVAAAVASLLSLRRVGISPLGVSRKATPPPPRAWRVIPLTVGLVVFIVPLASLGSSKQPNAGLAVLSLALIMIGLMVGGTWLTMQSSRVLARFASGPSSLLAARRLADNPKSAFRSVSGLVLAVFVGTFLAGAVPAALAAQQTPTDSALSDVLRVPALGPIAPTDPNSPIGLSPQAGATLVSQLSALSGVSVLPVYSAPSVHTPQSGKLFAPPPTVVSCQDLLRIPALGQCAPGETAVDADTSSLFYTDNIASLNKDLPIVTADSPVASQDLTTLNLGGVLVKVDNAATLEKVRTFLAVTYPDVSGGGIDSAPQTIGEVAQVRGALYIEAGNIVLLIVALTLLVAGCSLAIAMGGGTVERKRPFTLLRISGAAAETLRRVVLLESIIPLLGATVVAAITGFAAAVPVGLALTPKGTPSAVEFPDHTYYLTMGAGLLLSLAVIVMTLPLLNRVTMPANARFE